MPVAEQVAVQQIFILGTELDRSVPVVFFGIIQAQKNDQYVSMRDHAFFIAVCPVIRTLPSAGNNRSVLSITGDIIAGSQNVPEYGRIRLTYLVINPHSISETVTDTCDRKDPVLCFFFPAGRIAAAGCQQQDSDQEHGNAGRRPCPVRSVSIMLVVLSNSPHVLPQSVCLTSGPFRHLCYCIIFLR